MFRLSSELFVFLDEVFVSRKVLQALVFYVLWNDIKIVQEDIPHCNVPHQSTIRKYHPYQSTIQITIQKHDTKYSYQSTIYTKVPYKLPYKSTTQSTHTKVPSIPKYHTNYHTKVRHKVPIPKYHPYQRTIQIIYQITIQKYDTKYLYQSTILTWLSGPILLQGFLEILSTWVASMWG